MIVGECKTCIVIEVAEGARDFPALALARRAVAAGKKTLLIEADITGLTGLLHQLGLDIDAFPLPFNAVSVLSREASLNQAIIPCPMAGENYDIIFGNPYMRAVDNIAAASYLTMREDLALILNKYDKVVIMGGQFGNKADEAAGLFFAPLAQRVLLYLGEDCEDMQRAAGLLLALKRKSLEGSEEKKEIWVKARGRTFNTFAKVAKKMGVLINPLD